MVVPQCLNALEFKHKQTSNRNQNLQKLKPVLENVLLQCKVQPQLSKPGSVAGGFWFESEDNSGRSNSKHKHGLRAASVTSCS